jgi:hypothetical protein
MNKDKYELALSFSGGKPEIDDDQKNIEILDTISSISWSDELVQKSLASIRSSESWSLFRLEKISLGKTSISTTKNNNCIYYTVFLVQEGMGNFERLTQSTTENEFILQSYNNHLVCYQWNSKPIIKANFDGLLSQERVNLLVSPTLTEWDLGDLFTEFTILCLNYASFDVFLSCYNITLDRLRSDCETCHGMIDEYFALDTKGLEITVGKSETENRTKQVVMQSVFDELWAEISPKLQPLLFKTNYGGIEISSRYF